MLPLQKGTNEISNVRKTDISLLFFIGLFFLLPLACKLDLNHPYETTHTEYFKTQIKICIAQRFRNCQILGVNFGGACLFDENKFDDGCTYSP